MKKAVKLLALLLAAALAVAMLTGCGDEPETEEKQDELTRAAASDVVITLPEGMNAEASYEVKYDDAGMTIVFNGNNKWNTDYFTAPGGSLTISAKATGEAEGMKSFKISLWKKLDGGAEYVDESTIYYYTDGEMHTYTIEGLDPAAQYRITISYDAYGRHIFGQMRVDGAAALA